MTEDDIDFIIIQVLKKFKQLNNSIFYSTRLADINQIAQEKKNIIIYKFHLHLSIKKLEDVYESAKNKEYLDAVFEYVKN